MQVVGNLENSTFRVYPKLNPQKFYSILTHGWLDCLSYSERSCIAVSIDDTHNPTGSVDFLFRIRGAGFRDTTAGLLGQEMDFTLHVGALWHVHPVGVGGLFWHRLAELLAQTFSRADGTTPDRLNPRSSCLSN